MTKSFALASVLAASSVAAAHALSVDGFAELGLDDLDGTGAGTTAPASPLDETAAPSTDAVVSTEAKAERTEVQIGELEYGTLDIIPARRRGGSATGSKYKFETIAAPVAKEDGTGFNYSYALVTGAEGEDEQKLKRSVQSATNQANAQAKKDGSDERFINRQHYVKGVFAGVLIIRVDLTLEEEADEAAEG